MSRILVTLTPVTGHVRPALPLVRALVAEGHDVVVYTGRKFAEAVAATGAKHAPVVQGRDLDDADLEEWSVAHGAPAPGIARLRWDVEHHFVATVPGFLADLDELVAAERPDVLVMDNAFVAGGIAARRHHLPSVLFSVSPLAVASKDTAPFGLGLQPPRTGWDGLRYAALGWFTQKVVFRHVQRAARARGRRRGPRRSPRASSSTGCRPPPPACCTPASPGSSTRAATCPRTSSWSARSCLPAPTGSDPRVVGRRARGARHRPSGRRGHAGHRRHRRRTGCCGPPSTRSRTRTCWSSRPRRRSATRRTCGRCRFVPFDRLLPLADVLITNGGYGGVQQALAAGVPVARRRADAGQGRGGRARRLVRCRVWPCRPTRSPTPPRRTPWPRACDGCWTTRRSRGGPASSPRSTASTTVSAVPSASSPRSPGPGRERAAWAVPQTLRLGTVARSDVRSRVANVRSSAPSRACDGAWPASTGDRRSRRRPTRSVGDHRSEERRRDPGAHQGQADRRGDVRRAQAEHRARVRAHRPGRRRPGLPQGQGPAAHHRPAHRSPRRPRARDQRGPVRLLRRGRAREQAAPAGPARGRGHQGPRPDRRARRRGG